MKIAFHSLNCLFDPVSGAAKSVRTILEGLAARGHEVVSVTAACFDRPEHINEGDMLTSLGFEKIGKHWQCRDSGVNHIAFEGGASNVGKLNHSQMAHVARDVLDELEQIEPAVMLSYGGTSAELAVRAHMARRDTPVVFYLANPNYKDRECFEDVDLVMCDTDATSRHYRNSLALGSVVIGKFVHPVETVASETSRYVTFVNPTYEKGATLFYRIAEMMTEHRPETRFQVIESRRTLQSIQKETDLPFNRLANIRLAGPQRDMARVYARTKVLLIPSLWHESGPRVALEALSLGIPIVASDHIGVCDIVAGAGRLIKVPVKLRDTNRLIPPARIALPWVAAIEDLMYDGTAYQKASDEALLCWQKFQDLDGIGRVEEHLVKLIAH